MVGGCGKVQEGAVRCSRRSHDSQESCARLGLLKCFHLAALQQQCISKSLIYLGNRLYEQYKRYAYMNWDNEGNNKLAEVDSRPRDAAMFGGLAQNGDPVE